MGVAVSYPLFSQHCGTKTLMLSARLLALGAT
jgi:hypothetical protein